LLTVAEVVLQMKAAGKEIEIQEDVLANIGESVQSESGGWRTSFFQFGRSARGRRGRGK
jgi:hypothetical protein